jgi:hypothetical protein
VEDRRGGDDREKDAGQYGGRRAKGNQDPTHVVDRTQVGQLAAGSE